MKVAELMSTEIVTLGADDRLVTAIELMGLRRFRHLPVVEGRDKLVGLVTDKDMAQAGNANLPPNELMAHKARTKVRDFMRKRVTTVGPDTPVVEAARTMISHKFGCLPVVQDGKLVGILTEADFLSMVVSLLEHAGEDASYMAQLQASMAR